MQEPYETPVDEAIREARERGEFDNLPGAEKPLPSLGDMDDPDWWVKAYAVREGLDLPAAMPPVLALPEEAAGFPRRWRTWRPNRRCVPCWRALRAASHPDFLAPTVPPGEAGSKRSWWTRWRRPNR